MTREMLFRGKRLDNGEWVEGFYARIHDGKGNVSHRIYTGYAESDCGDFYPENFEIAPSTVGQFTGKMDVNGKKVFEHDILQLYTVWVDGTRTKSAKVIVQWWENDQCYVLTTKEGYHCNDFGNYGRPEYFEVIGNIHDNPELLEGKG